MLGNPDNMFYADAFKSLMLRAPENHTLLCQIHYVS